MGRLARPKPIPHPTYQVAEINAGRGPALRLGPYVLLAGRTAPGYLRSYVARHVETGQLYQLSVIEAGDEDDADRMAESLGSLAGRSSGLDASLVSPIVASGHQGRRVFFLQPPFEGLHRR